ncbi:hypothetical protein Q8F55_002277 [Vanrija albida]|uniref:Uncharacterized protein n=1 Tax=Vanrija albida TaxID=181172 RepID=A0ABR3Q9A9_9TREE
MLLGKLLATALLLVLPAAAAPANPRDLDAAGLHRGDSPRRAAPPPNPCTTPQFKGQLQALQCTLGAHGAGKFGALLGTLASTSCSAVYPLVTGAQTVLAPQDSAVTPALVGQFTANPALLGQYYSTTKALHRTDFFNQANRVIQLASVSAIYWVGGMASLWMEIQGTTTEAVVLTTDISTATGTALILKNAWGQPATLV